MVKLRGNTSAHRHGWLTLLALVPLACSNTPNNVVTFNFDASGHVDRPVDHVVHDAQPRLDVAPDAAGFQCFWPGALDDGGVAGCAPSRAFVTCTEAGGSASYTAATHNGCLACSGTCTDSCGLGEFALSCATAPTDAAVSSGPAHGCHFSKSFPFGSVVYCCPCQ
jgi:hypothetical protein